MPRLTTACVSGPLVDQVLLTAVHTKHTLLTLAELSTHSMPELSNTQEHWHGASQRGLLNHATSQAALKQP